jgi:hypothetical protein
MLPTLPLFIHVQDLRVKMICYSRRRPQQTCSCPRSLLLSRQKSNPKLLAQCLLRMPNLRCFHGLGSQSPSQSLNLPPLPLIWVVPNPSLPLLRLHVFLEPHGLLPPSAQRQLPLPSQPPLPNPREFKWCLRCVSVCETSNSDCTLASRDCGRVRRKLQKRSELGALVGFSSWKRAPSPTKPLPRRRAPHRPDPTVIYHSMEPLPLAALHQDFQPLPLVVQPRQAQELPAIHPSLLLPLAPRLPLIFLLPTLPPQSLLSDHQSLLGRLPLLPLVEDRHWATH